MHHSAQRPASQQGMVLIISLLFLLIMTVAGLAAMQGSTLQEKMAGNNRDQQLAFLAAEAALRDAEHYLQGTNIGPFDGNNGLYPSSDTTANDWHTTTSWRNYSGSLASTNQPPKYFIKQFEDTAGDTNLSLAADEAVTPDLLYSITAQGYGSTANSQVILQSTYRR